MWNILGFPSLLIHWIHTESITGWIYLARYPLLDEELGTAKNTFSGVTSAPQTSQRVQHMPSFNFNF